MVNKQGFYVELESLRGVMAWWVVFGHLYSCFRQALGNVPSLINDVLLATAVPVDIFICLSGFFIAKVLSGGNIGYRPYIVRRAFRIIPVYLVAITLATVLFNERMSVRMDLPWNTSAQVAAVEHYWASIAGNLTAYLVPCLVLLQGVIPDQWLPHAGDAFLAPAWSLTLEWQFYLIAPLIAGAFVLRRGKELITASSVLVLLLLVNSGLTFSYGSFIFIKLPVFIIGMLTHDLFRRDGGEWRNGALIVALVLAVGLINRSFAGVASIGVWSCVAILFKLQAQLDQPVLSKLLELAKAPLKSRLLVRLGVLSYSTYMIHILVIDGVLIAATKAGYLKGDLVALFITVSIVLTYVVSSLMHRCVEVPLIAAGKRVAVSAHSRALKCE